MTHRSPSRRQILAGLSISPLFISACSKAQTQDQTQPQSNAATGRAGQLIEAARAQIGVTQSYDPAYTGLSYPGGDVPREKGVCTDVIIRAYRDALGLDLQREVHEDMKGNFAAYPKIWGLSRPDRNIDHRRVPNLRTFWRRAESELTVPRNPSVWQPGDIFTSMIDGRLPHTGIVSDRRAGNGRLLVIHNIGQGTREEDALYAHPINGRYRWRLDV